MVKAEFEPFQMQRKGVLEHALELPEAGLGKVTERLDADDMGGALNEFVLTVTDANVPVEAHVH